MENSKDTKVDKINEQVSQIPGMPELTALNGVHFEKKLRRSVTEEAFGATVSAVKNFDVVTKVQLTGVVWKGQSERLNENYVSVQGHYAPGKFIRLTGFSQNGPILEKVLQEFKEKKYASLTAAGDAMAGYGMNVRELEAVLPDGTKKVIISDPNAKPVGAGPTL